MCRPMVITAIGKTPENGSGRASLADGRQVGRTLSKGSRYPTAQIYGYG